MGKRIPMAQRNATTVLSMVSLRVREQVERIARRDRISISEVGRLAITAYIEQKQSA